MPAARTGMTTIRSGMRQCRPPGLTARLSFGDRSEYGRDRFRGSAGRGVDDQVVAVPRLVLPAGDLPPVRQPQAGDVHLAGPGRTALELGAAHGASSNWPFLIRPRRGARPATALSWVTSTMVRPRRRHRSSSRAMISSLVPSSRLPV